MTPTELVQTVGSDGDALRKELGIPVTSIERDLLAGEQPDAILVLEGDVDRDTVDDATAATTPGATCASSGSRTASRTTPGTARSRT